LIDFGHQTQTAPVRETLGTMRKIPLNIGQSSLDELQILPFLRNVSGKGTFSYL